MAQQGQERDGGDGAFQKRAINTFQFDPQDQTLKEKKKKKKIYLFGYSQPVFYKETTTKHTTYVWFVKGFSPLFDSEDFYMWKAKCWHFQLLSSEKCLAKEQTYSGF